MAFSAANGDELYATVEGIGFAALDCPRCGGRLRLIAL
jgi:hypothetical protein